MVRRKAAELSQEAENGGKLSGTRSIPQKRKLQEEKVDPADKVLLLFSVRSQEFQLSSF
jgi:hypothetical protein